MMIEVLVILIILGVMSWFFGFWDHLADKAGVTVPQIIGVVIGGTIVGFICFVGSAVLLYFALAYCHKWFGPIVFGG